MASTVRSRALPHLGIQGQHAVAQLGQEVLAGVGHTLELLEAEKAARPLHRMDGAEDRGDDLTVAGVLLEQQELLVEPVEVLVALDQELLHQAVKVAHGASVP